jgi:enamine deaminase RidA (YjgF/YER057c/UK114 family)
MLAAAARVGIRTMSSSAAEARLAALGLSLPPPARPVASYVMATRVGNLLYTSGHLPQPGGGAPLIVGKVGAELTAEQGAAAAQVVALNILATVKAELGSLERVARVVKLTGFVNCVDGFAGQPAVVNGASNLFKEVLGEKGVHARSAVGTNALPLNVPVEIEAIIEIAA